MSRRGGWEPRTRWSEKRPRPPAPVPSLLEQLGVTIDDDGTVRHLGSGVPSSVHSVLLMQLVVTSDRAAAVRAARSREAMEAYFRSLADHPNREIRILARCLVDERSAKGVAG